ncbi:MAG TPA: protein translocase subunit SecD [Pyrinomonadaceae bacterium]|jgi:preprotein translocase subunit SecD|nr:protein translocase subunit SecD [Pyrinomonadaceae bacterium]
MKKKHLLHRTIIIAVVTLVGLYLVIGPRRRPTLKDFTWSGIKATMASNIHLGLDLQGGSHLVMRVKTDEYLKRLTEEAHVSAENAAKDAGFEVKDGRAETNPGNYRVVLVPADASKINEIKEAIDKKAELADTTVWSYSASGGQMTWTMSGTAQRVLADEATNQALTIIERRINALGVTEPTLQTHGAKTAHQILLQMPGVSDPERVKEILKGESRLELVHVVGPGSPSPPTTYPTRDAAIQSLGGQIPANRDVLPYKEKADPTKDANQPAVTSWVVVERPAVITGDQLSGANAGQAQGGGVNDWEIDFRLKRSGAEKFGAWTTANVNNYMGVVLNGEVSSVAYIKSPIYDRGQITGRFSQAQAEDLALTLRSGALPAAIEYLEERTVGPSLGADSIRAGVRASLYGLAFVVFFMLLYYRGSGVNAVVALILNMILMLAGLIVFGATLTLPGIAGMILTIGMAVDSNVLIFERIREEIHSGKTIPSAVEQGFSRAFITIIDTHVTTIISSLFLFVFGTGPIRGFAVTLVIGLLVNLFSAVYVSKTIFIWLLSRKEKVESLSI